MNKGNLILLVLFLLAMFAMSGQLWAQTKMPTGFDAYVAKVLSGFRVPGMSIVVVKDGKLVMAKGFGVKESGKSDLVDEKTLFPIASNSKAFTAAALEILVEDGKLSWDDPVVTHLPWFRMADPWVTAQITVRDLLVHNSGITAYAADILNFPPTDYTRRQILEKVRQLPLGHSFRTTYAYDNILYLAAGEIVRTVSGMEWEEFVRTRILLPLDMNGTLSRFTLLSKEPNRASGHGMIEGKLAVYDQALQQGIGDAGDPAGGIASNAMDMGKWLMAQLDSGKAENGHRIWSSKGTEELWKIVNPIPVSKTAEWLAPAQSDFSGYALGLRTYNYGAYKIVGHGGKLDGFVSQVTMVPSLRLGIAVLTNQESTGAYWSVIYTLLDHYLQNKPFDWMNGYLRSQDSSVARMARERQKNIAIAPTTAAPASLDLAGYTGSYRDTLYGDVQVRQEEHGLVIHFMHSAQLVADLEHAHHDVYIAHFRNRSLKADAWTTFTIGPDGKPFSMTLKVIDPDSDLGFEGLLFIRHQP